MAEIIKVVLVDDEPGNLQNLEDLLARYCPEVEVCATVINLQQAKAAIEKYRPDLVLLDIQLGAENGFDLLSAPHTTAFEVVFVTAYSEYGIKAIKFAALDYILKPVDPAELQQAINKLQVKQHAKTQHAQINSLLQYLQKQPPHPLHRIALPAAKETRLVAPDDIIRCESLNSYTKFFLKNGEQLMISKPIFEYDALLTDYGFVRCHQSHLVNTQFIKSHTKEGHGSLVLTTGDAIPISRLKKELVREVIYKKV